MGNYGLDPSDSGQRPVTGSCEPGNKWRRISWLAEWLSASEEGLCFMELVSIFSINIYHTSNQIKLLARFDIFTVEKIQVKVLCGVTPCSVVVGYQRFGGSCCLHLQGDLELKCIALKYNYILSCSGFFFQEKTVSLIWALQWSIEVVQIRIIISCQTFLE
jgi:hypothetical protein